MAVDFAMEDLRKLEELRSNYEYMRGRYGAEAQGTQLEKHLLFVAMYSALPCLLVLAEKALSQGPEGTL